MEPDSKIDSQENDIFEITREQHREIKKCDACSDKSDQSFTPETYYLTLGFYSTWIALCPKHEDSLFLWLLSNRIRRMAKGKVVFPISKSLTLKLINAPEAEEWVFSTPEDIPQSAEPTEEEENPPSAMEKVQGVS